MAEDLFHPAVAGWFRDRFGTPSAVQAAAWPAIAAGRHALLSAPTGSGKTLAAFLAVIDRMVRDGLDVGLAEKTHVLYVSPLKALSNDIEINLRQPLQGIADSLLEHGRPPVPIRVAVRTGDTPQGEREKMRRHPPHILVTTPESLYILLTSASGREMLRGIRALIIDEIHALAGNKRGAHLALSLERLEALAGRPLQRIGISATQEPIEGMAAFLVGARDTPCEIVNLGHSRQIDLGLELPRSPLSAVMSAEAWAESYDRLAALAQHHRTTLIFVNTRRLAERVAHHLADRLGEDAVTAHHGSLSRESRLSAEQRLKSGSLRALVATASLELGIDIGDIDLVCQLGSPRNIAVLLQRVGRSGHALAAIPKGRLFPLSRDDLVECVALLGAARERRLDHIAFTAQPLDVLAQQIVAEVAAREWKVDELLEVFRRSLPYRQLTQETFSAVLRMLADGFSTRVGRRGAHVHWDRVNGMLRARKGARLTAVTNGGVIPDQFDYDVILLPEGLRVGSLNEDFAFESSQGDIFQLGNTSYRIRKVQTGQVLVEDARGQPPNIPFWFGEAPGRSDELSAAVSRLRTRLEARLETGIDRALDWVAAEYALPPAAAEQLVAYLGAAHAALGVLPTQDRVVLERFFDETGDMHLVVHSTYGSRINRAWGLALRKRFCRTFNFELQAAALEDCIILSLGAVHSFPLADVSHFLSTATVRGVLTQALLDVPVFATHWRWNATTALAVKRFRNGRKVPPQFQRSDAEDLVSLVFPDQLACLENIQGEREIPDHPLVGQTLQDCLTGVMDIEGLERLLSRIESGQLEIAARDLAAPSPLAEEIVAARPYAFLDEAPAEERRTRAVRTRGPVSPEEAGRIARLDPAAVAQVRREAWPRIGSPDELHDALVLCGFLTPAECGTPAFTAGETADGDSLFEALAAGGRATRVLFTQGGSIICAAERLAELAMAHPPVATTPAIDPPPGITPPAGREPALREIVRSRLECLGPVTAEELAEPLGLPPTDIAQALLALESEGFAVRGRFDEALSGEQWCERRLLARIHRYTVRSLRREISPVGPAAFMRFLFHWQGLTGGRQAGVEGTAAVLDRLAGFNCAAAAWEEDVLPSRIASYAPEFLDNLTATGRYVWVRLRTTSGTRAPVRASPVAIVPRRDLWLWQDPARQLQATDLLSAGAQQLLEALRRRGARFFSDLVRDAGLARHEAESALGELVTAGMASADNYAGLRALITPAAGRKRRAVPRSTAPDPLDAAGRWDLVPLPPPAESPEQRLEPLARLLLNRYGIVFRALLDRESGLPPWRDLIRTFWRLEARGEARGGRFVEGFSGEQFAHPEAVARLRTQDSAMPRESLVVISGADPANLTGIVSPGERIPATPGNRILYRDGLPAATLSGGEIRLLVPARTNDEWQFSRLLTRSAEPAGTGTAWRIGRRGGRSHTLAG